MARLRSGWREHRLILQLRRVRLRRAEVERGRLHPRPRRTGITWNETGDYLPSFGGFGLDTGIFAGFSLRLATGILAGFWLSGMTFRSSLLGFPMMTSFCGGDVSCCLFWSDIVFSILDYVL